MTTTITATTSGTEATLYKAPSSPSHAELLACQFSSWYSTFRNLQKNDPQRPYKNNNVTIRSIIIQPLPFAFIEYLQSDGVVLPKGAEKVSSFLPDINSDDDDVWSSDGSHDGNGDNNDNDVNKDNDDNDKKRTRENDDTTNDDNGNDTPYHFPDLNDKINHALEVMGPVIPKLNWSSPKDVTWINGETMKCSTVGDIYLLLQSSDFCMFDLTHALDGVDDDTTGSDTRDTRDTSSLEYELVLRKWSNLHASMEFRCFVSHHNLVAISQRNHSQHFPHLKNDIISIRQFILDFFINTIQYTFANGEIPNYVFDVYIDKNHRVWLIDFNVWAERTDTLLFKWDEILTVDETKYSADIDPEGNCNVENAYPELRVVMNENEVLYDPLASYRAPIDTVNLASETMGAHSFQDFMAMCQRPSAMNDSSDEEDDT